MVHEKDLTVESKSKLPQRLNCIPILHVRGTHYSVGFSIGRMFKSMIRDMLGSWKYFNNVLLKEYSTETGREMYQKSFDLCKQKFPNYMDEIRGMAEGADVAFEKLFLLNIDSIITTSESSSSNGDIHKIRAFEGHGETGCTSIICNKDEAILGHTEDAMGEILNNVYIVSAEVVDEERKTVEKFTSFSYAGHLMGYTMGFNNHGMIHSVNTLFPTVHTTGTPRSFIARAILGAQNLEDLLETIRDTGSGISDGFSLNVHFAKDGGPRLFHNIEVAPPIPDAQLESILDVATINPGESFIHCNKYLRIQVTENSTPVAVSTSRHETIENLHEPEGVLDIERLLSDQSDANYPVFMCDNICTKLSHVKTVAVGIFNLNEKTWSIYLGQPSNSSPVAVIPMNY